jgi:hypothetical protein
MLKVMWMIMKFRNHVVSYQIKINIAMLEWKLKPPLKLIFNTDLKMLKFV